MTFYIQDYECSDMSWSRITDDHNEMIRFESRLDALEACARLQSSIVNNGVEQGYRVVDDNAVIQDYSRE